MSKTSLPSASPDEIADQRIKPATATKSTPSGPVKTAVPQESLFRRLTYKYAVLGVLIFVVAFFSIAAPETFFTFENLRVVTSSQSVLIIAALGLVIPFAAGEFDLSFGPMIAWSSIVLAVLNVQLGLPGEVAIPIAVGSTMLWGLLNSYFIVKIGISSMITTLGMGTVITGLTLAVSGSQVIAGAPAFLNQIATTQLFGLPLPVYLAFLLAVIVWLFMEHTPLGRYIYFTGEGREVARLSGLPTDRIRVFALTSSAFFCGLAGVLNVGRLGSADPNLGASFLLPGAAAVFLGATVIKPGRFNAWGTVIAVFLVVTGVTGLQMLGGAGWLENVFNGAALVLAVSFAAIVSRKSASSS
ncbi:ABC transporter permease [Arthrobacter sp. StoSoilB5]|uniref:ABC transporter permease n=1 Tax=Arthrobacter sp. StoSoilB5 TaxID=2830992 RepID=UPI001CC49638|nr:ABC transporter permease [Arthrobacter sp. StoSoilB5]BCW45366.1 sugar ABC transporter permease [Arthrobacter sp. StoSoilB5]